MRAADADDHGEHQHLHAGRHDVAQHPLGEKRRAIPQRKGNQHETGERGELEFDQRHEQLHREHEEADQHDEPGQEQHDDAVEVQEHARKAGEVADLGQNGMAGVDADPASRPGCRNCVDVSVDPEATSPRPAKERKRMLESALKLVMMKAKAPT